MMIGDICDSWLRFLMNKFFKKELSDAFKKEVEIRFKTCMFCTHMRKKEFLNSKAQIRFCDICKCGFPGMIFSYKKSCPLQKWDSFSAK
jgi:hypothetical protein